ncbi:hypothetical protein TrLO_g10302 [Triparma laevis f. longispina]|uniref:Uncharacterized protein n=1 Tax=Triparma laevis f. longispina TaxID=1714387 RepID=A0A9W7FP71_9STRA|nr:hypothetical protein TrLO_g10302 [Triparma laevis f. longispina]
MPPSSKRRKGNEEEGANSAAIPQDVNVRTRSRPCRWCSSMREEMKATKQEMNEKMESVLEELKSVESELKSVNGKLRDKKSAKPRERHVLLSDADEKLKAMVRLWCSNKDEAETRYGHISGWDTSAVTSMRFLFGATTEEIKQGNHWNKDFNEDLSLWDTSSVTTMAFMFIKASSLTGDLSG